MYEDVNIVKEPPPNLAANVTSVENVRKATNIIVSPQINRIFSKRQHEMEYKREQELLYLRSFDAIEKLFDYYEKLFTLPDGFDFNAKNTDRGVKVTVKRRPNPTIFECMEGTLLETNHDRGIRNFSSRIKTDDEDEEEGGEEWDEEKEEKGSTCFTIDDVIKRNKLIETKEMEMWGMCGLELFLNYVDSKNKAITGSGSGSGRTKLDHGLFIGKRSKHKMSLININYERFPLGPIEVNIVFPISYSNFSIKQIAKITEYPCRISYTSLSAIPITDPIFFASLLLTILHNPNKDLAKLDIARLARTIKSGPFKGWKIEAKDKNSIWKPNVCQVRLRRPKPDF